MVDKEGSDLLQTPLPFPRGSHYSTLLVYFKKIVKQTFYIYTYK